VYGGGGISPTRSTNPLAPTPFSEADGAGNVLSFGSRYFGAPSRTWPRAGFRTTRPGTLRGLSAVAADRLHGRGVRRQPRLDARQIRYELYFRAFDRKTATARRSTGTRRSARGGEHAQGTGAAPASERSWPGAAPPPLSVTWTGASPVNPEAARPSPPSTRSWSWQPLGLLGDRHARFGTTNGFSIEKTRVDGRSASSSTRWM